MKREADYVPTKQDIEGIVELCGDDGHGIIDPQGLLDRGVNPEIVERYTMSHESDGSPKGTIFVQGVAVKELRGVYTLSILSGMAHRLGLKWKGAFGRGTEARQITAALRVWLKKQEEER